MKIMHTKYKKLDLERKRTKTGCLIMLGDIHTSGKLPSMVRRGTDIPRTLVGDVDDFQLSHRFKGIHSFPQFVFSSGMHVGADVLTFCILFFFFSIFIRTRQYYYSEVTDYEFMYPYCVLSFIWIRWLLSIRPNQKVKLTI